MTAATSLVLGGCLAVVPALMVKLSQVEVNRLGKKWTATDCSVGPITSLDLLVSFVEDVSMCNIQFFYMSIDRD